MSDKVCICLGPPRPITPQRTWGPMGASIVREIMWPNGATIPISFLNGSPQQKEFVRQTAGEWPKVCNVKFEWVEQGGLCRILFGTGGSYSYLGQSCRQVRQGPTMEFGWLDREVVWHEFGHLLGLEHGQNAPNFPYHWKRDLVVKDFSGPPNNWDAATIENNIFDRSDHTNHSEFDPDSIMQYYFPGRYFDEGVTLAPSGEISAIDRRFMSQVYPFPANPTPAPPAPVTPEPPAPMPPTPPPANRVLSPGYPVRGQAPDQIILRAPRTSVYLLALTGSGLRLATDGRLGIRHRLTAGDHVVHILGRGQYSLSVRI